MRGEERKKMHPVLKELISTGLYVLGVLALTFFVITFVGQRVEVQGESMENTLDNGDHLIVDKLTYHFKEPQRFDIIVFPIQYEPNTYYIKRIMALPGETVSINESGTIYVNGQVLQESYGREIIAPENLGRATESVTLGPDEYFVMGDNRNNSTDSRMEIVGNIHRKDIIGRAWLRIWPLEKFGVVQHQKEGAIHE